MNNQSDLSAPTALHQPVMLEEVMQYLQPQADQCYIDATFGRGGHTREILKTKAQVIAFDIDQEAIAYAQSQFSEQITNSQLFAVHSRFAQLESEITKLRSGQAEIAPIHGVLFDFGTSQDQLKAPHRGFSFDHPDAPLDMRMDQALGVTAADLINALPTQQLEQLFKEYGGERNARKIVQAIESAKGKDRRQQISTVGQLVQIIEQVQQRHSHLHPATKVFQALRIAVNSELDEIQQALPQALKLLEPGGRLITIAFHQGEDAIAKHQFKQWAEEKKGNIITVKPLQPTLLEKQNNPSARSAKLRVFEK
jgi:16S rRNA (cytosine1402-N4)-methyltransferase